jgi:hypothetical protein
MFNNLNLKIMKARLYKTGNEYLLKDLNGEVIAITNGSTEGRKLSKQNCDEIFGAVDVEKLFDEVDKTIDFHEFCFTSFKLGLNKAMELNKDKVFDEKSILGFGQYVWRYGGGERSMRQLLDDYKHPERTEISVEIVMETASLNPHDLICEEIVQRPKLDSEGCLILTKLTNP